MTQSGMRVTPAAAMRARDVSRPHAEHDAAAARRPDAPRSHPQRGKKRTRPGRPPDDGAERAG